MSGERTVNNCRVGYRRVKAVSGGEWLADFTPDNRRKFNELVDVNTPVTINEAYAICRAWGKTMNGHWLYLPIWLYENEAGRLCTSPIGDAQLSKAQAL
jgi:hypothetical protein